MEQTRDTTTLRGRLKGGRSTVSGKDGHAYAIRPIHPDDAPSLMRGYDAMTDQLKWFRMLHAVPHLTETMALEFCTPDPKRDLCLVLEGRGDLEGEILGGARISGASDGHSCEFSVSLRPEAQSLGLARGALRTVFAAAKERGYAQVWGSIHVRNEAMLHLAQSLGFRLRRDPEDVALVVAEMPLTPEDDEESHVMPPAVKDCA